MPTALVWFRNDLRLDDQPALQAALAQGYAPVPVYIHAPDEAGPHANGAASDAWRHRSLHALDGALRARRSRLTVLRGPTLPALERLAAATGAEAVFWTRRYEPAFEQRDTTIKRALRRGGLHAESFNGALLIEPWDVATKQGDPYRVFTPFWKTASAQLRKPRPWDAPKRLPAPPEAADATTIDALGLAPKRGWDHDFWTQWFPGEIGARAALTTFLPRIAAYPDARDVPAIEGTSRLSPHLHFGEVSVQRVFAAIGDADAPPKRARPTSANSAGASSRITCCTISRTRWTATSTRASTTSTGPRSMRCSSMRGRAAAPASRSSMPACASCGTPAGCTTGCACWWRVS